MKSSKALFLVIALVLTTLVAGAGSALANTAANTQIVNQAKLTFNGGSASASVSVTVSLVPSTPNVSITYGNAAYTAPNTPTITDTVTITATANGPASYTVAPSIPSGGTSNVLSSSPASVNATTPTVTVGATVSTGTSGTTFVTVPSGLASGSGNPVNGIGINSTVVFTVNGHSYTELVTGTTDNGNGTFTISWATAIPSADVPPAGVLIAEQKAVAVTVLPGTVQTAGTNITVGVAAAVSTGGAATANVTTASPNTWTTPTPNVTLTKYVRNVTSGTAGTAGSTSFTINNATNTYYTVGVTGKPGDTLEYVLVASNTGSTDLTGSAISDLVPIAYLNFVNGPGPYSGNAVFYIDPSNATSALQASTSGTQATYVAASTPNLVVNVGTNASPSATGTIPAGKSVTIAYQAVIK